MFYITIVAYFVGAFVLGWAAQRFIRLSGLAAITALLLEGAAAVVLSSATSGRIGWYALLTASFLIGALVSEVFREFLTWESLWGSPKVSSED